MDHGIKVGDWVTQYSAGFWQILELHPKYADEDYDRNGLHWKKGDRLGDWAIVKKGFSPKMKPGNSCEVIDASWCKKVSPETVEAIRSAFEQNPKAKMKFDKAPSRPAPYVASVWLNLSKEEEKAVYEILRTLPAHFTAEELWTAAGAYRRCMAQPPATHILYLSGYPWEVNDGFDPLYFEANIKPVG